MPIPAASIASSPREIRVFVSSTFRDMQKERELLVKEVFPELRRVCDERFVSFTEVDLRWASVGREGAARPYRRAFDERVGQLIRSLKTREMT